MKSPYFFDVFNGLDMDEDTSRVFKNIRIEKVVSNKEKSFLKVFLQSETKVSEGDIFSIERKIKVQMFPELDTEVMLILPDFAGVETPGDSGGDLADNMAPPMEERPWDDDFKNPVPTETAEGMGPGMDAGESNAPAAVDKKGKKPADDSEKKKKQKKSYGENVYYGRPIKETETIIKIHDLDAFNEDVVIRGMVFKTDSRVLSNEKILLSLFISDYTDSIVAKLFLEEEEANELSGKIKENPFIKIKSMAGVDKYDNELTLKPVRSIEASTDFRIKREDFADEKRVELHAHTKMSDMEATLGVKEYIGQAKAWGHEACAITDSGVVYAFPDAAKSAKDIKVIYGLEARLCDDTKPIINPGDRGEYPLTGDYVVFDLETTGLNASKEDIIEIGAVHVSGGEIVDRFSAFINPGRPLPYEIIELTGIDDGMLKDAPPLEEVLPKFLEYIGDKPLVAHNADFDVSCMIASAKRLGILFNPIYMDTVAIARILLPELFRYRLDNVSKALNIVLANHHRAVDDAEATANIYNKFVEMLLDRGVDNLNKLSQMETKGSDIVKKLFPANATILCKNDLGRLNLYRLVSMSHLTYYYQQPRIPKSELIKHREGLLIGSGTARGELFDALLSGKNEKEIERIVSFYDFLEVQPAENYTLMTKSSRYGIKTLDDIRELNARIVQIGEKYNIPVCATGDVHYLEPTDEVYTRIILSEKKNSRNESEPNQYFRTTDEMLDLFSYLGTDKAYEIVVKNTNDIARMIENIRPTRPDKCPPVIENSDLMLREICNAKAKTMYGETLPKIVEERLERELNSIISNGYALMYIIAQKLVWKSNEDGYIVGSRGSVGSSFVATLAGISEVNPLPAHYLCHNCHYTDFDSQDVKDCEGMAGCDMPDKVCPVCGQPLSKEGFDIPFETFLGFEGDKEPDIDLNFSGEYLNKAHKYTEVIFGEGQTVRAGTVGTLADKTAYMYTKGYAQKKEIPMRGCEIERIAEGCVGVRRTTGQHPGGIIVLPMGEEMESFTPVQHPANKMDSDIVTTHFDFHSIDSNLLKLDILGKDDPTQIRLLEDMTGLGVNDIPLDDKKVMSLFQNTDAIGLSPEELMGIDFGTLGIPEFGTDFAMGILRDTKPQGIMDLVRIAGLSHGTDVWNGNAKELIAQEKATIQTAICTRDDIMLYLQSMGVPSQDSFVIMEAVRKGKGLKPEWEELMRECGVPDWYIWSCNTIKYMFPKAHAAAYVMMAYRLGYYKVYEPLAFYAAYFSIKATAFDYEMMCFGPEVLMHHLEEFKSRPKLTDKEKNAIRDMKVVYEMYKRGYEFVPIDIYESDAVYFKLKDGKIQPPFNVIDGMGEIAAITLAMAAKTPFSSKDDIKRRGNLTGTVLETMDRLGILDGFSQSNQLSLFDLM